MYKDEPIFIVGHPRSGSTLLATRLGLHSKMFATPETHFFSSSYSGNAFKRIMSYRGIEEFFEYFFKRNVRIQDIPGSNEFWKNKFSEKRIKTFAAAFECLSTCLLSEANKVRLVEKTPTHIEHIRRILRMFPRARIVVIIRDPRDAVDSLVNVPWVHSNADRHVAYWGWCVRKALKWMKKRPSNVLLVRYEDLLERPEETLKSVLSFVGEKFEKEMLDDAMKSSTVPDWEAGWKEKSLGKIDASFAYRWKKTTKAESLAGYASRDRLIRNELLMLGYERATPVNESKIKVSDCLWVSFVFDAVFGLNLWLRTHVKPRMHRYRRSQLLEQNDRLSE